MLECVLYICTFIDFSLERFFECLCVLCCASGPFFTRSRDGMRALLLLPFLPHVFGLHNTRDAASVVVAVAVAAVVRGRRDSMRLVNMTTMII